MPLISICVPTFNRAHFLANLLGNLHAIHAEHGNLVEFCVSNNCSTDATQELLAEFGQKVPVKIVKQPTNIGSMMNVKAVAELGTADYILVMGDDDLIDLDGFRALLEHLRNSARVGRWLFVNVASTHSFSGYRVAPRAREASAAETLRFLLRTGLDKLGFVGVHVIPRVAVHDGIGLTQREISCWPHIAWLVRHACLRRAPAEFLPCTVVRQSGGGTALFWQPASIVKVVLQRQQILRHIATPAAPWQRVVCVALRLRDLYSPVNLGLAASWRICEPLEFSMRARSLYVDAYGGLGCYIPAVLPHVLYLACLRLTPRRLLLWLLPAQVRRKILELDRKRSELPESFDGEKRVL